MLYQIGSTWFLYGITSFAIASKNQSCNPTSPTYFTSVPIFIDWINQQVNDSNNIKINNNYLNFYLLILILLIN